MLVLRPGALGDTLLAVPALRAVRQTRGPITLAAHASAARLLHHVGEVDASVPFDDPRIGRVLRGADPGEAVVAWLDAASAPGLRALLVAPSRPSEEVHAARYLLETLAPLGVDQDLDDSALRVDPIRSEEVLVHPGSGSARKNWPAERFAALIQRLPTARLIVGDADTAAAADVERALGRPLPRLDHPDLLELARRLAGCKAYFGNDSGVSHLAGLSGAPSYVLFGPTSATVWRPVGPNVVVLPFDASPEEVADAVGG